MLIDQHRRFGKRVAEPLHGCEACVLDIERLLQPKRPPQVWKESLDRL
jgi:hypothetical protein